ncbi:monothiol glutaredoxin grx5 [Ceratobasidium sp. 414]|nr:monothiol glutaredoxin grx5 [Ceratobasidium sp. 414]
MFRAGLRLAIPARQLRQAVPPSRISVRLLSDEVRKTIDKVSVVPLFMASTLIRHTQAVKSTPLVLFMKGTPDIPECGFSRAVIQILQLHDVPKDKMKTYNVLEDAELRNSIKEYSDWPTVPQLYVDGQFIGGCDIVMNMHQSGELEELLEKNKIIPPLPPNAE